MYNTILFDLDGTLTDSGTGIINSAIHALKKMGIEETDREKLKAFIGPPLTYSFQTFYGCSEEESLKAVEYYREYFSVDGKFENSVYEGIREVLEELRNNGRRLVVATSKPELFTHQILEHFDLDKYFDFVASATMDETRNTKPEVIKYALESCGLTDMSDLVMVGDRHHDIDGANAFGIDSVGVLYGYGSRAELEEAGATYIAETPADILKCIL